MSGGQDFREKFKRAYFQAQDDPNYRSVEAIKDQKMLNGMTYVLHLEDHTLGDLLRIALLKKREVRFAGYRMPHPLVDKIEIKVQTSTDKTNEVVRETLNGVARELNDLEAQFERKIAEASF